MLFQSEGVDGQRRAGAIRRAAQHAIATRVVDVLLLIGRGSMPLRQAVQQVIAERGAGVAVTATGYLS